MNSTADKQTFEIIGTVERCQAYGKTTRLRIKTAGQFGKYHDIVLFRPVNDVGKGARVRVAGDVSNKKLEGHQQQGKDGRMYDTWIPELVGREVDTLAPGQGRIPGVDARNDNADESRRDDDGNKIPF